MTLQGTVQKFSNSLDFSSLLTYETDFLLQSFTTDPDSFF